MSTVLQLDDFGLEHFAQLAASFGQHHYGYVVTPNVDHVIRYWDEASFREFYAGASFVLLDSRFLARLLRAIKGLRLQACPGSDLTSLLFNRIIAPDDKVVLIGGTASQAQALVQQRGLRALRHYEPPMGFIHDPAAVDGTFLHQSFCQTVDMTLESRRASLCIFVVGIVADQMEINGRVPDKPTSLAIMQSQCAPFDIHCGGLIAQQEVQCRRHLFPGQEQTTAIRSANRTHCTVNHATWGSNTSSLRHHSRVSSIP